MRNCTIKLPRVLIHIECDALQFDCSWKYVDFSDFSNVYRVYLTLIVSAVQSIESVQNRFAIKTMRQIGSTQLHDPHRVQIVKMLKLRNLIVIPLRNASSNRVKPHKRPKVYKPVEAQVASLKARG